MAKRKYNEQLYFAYGSNINLEQMAYRCPGAKVYGPAVLEGYELLFRGGSSRGCGVATVTPKEGSRVEGLLWRITPANEESLDMYEGYPSFYEKETLTVKTSNGQGHEVMAYVMTNERLRAPSPPSLRYYTGIKVGFIENGLPLQPLRDALAHCYKEVVVYERMQNKQQNKLPKHRGQER